MEGRYDFRMSLIVPVTVRSNLCNFETSRLEWGISFLQVCQRIAIGSWGSRKLSFVFLEKSKITVDSTFPLLFISRLAGDDLPFQECRD